MSLALALLSLTAGAAAQANDGGVSATGPMGPSNPPQAILDTEVDQTSMSRLASLNSVEDWCIFAPPEAGPTIGDAESVVVSWCTKPRNNARVIPDGVITGASFIKTDFYVELKAYGDFTKINIQDGDYGGELDPHGATGKGNPVGGNVTTNAVDGDDRSYAEWMSFISYSQVCFRICTNANSTWDAPTMCEHKLDVMGCQFVMPGNYEIDGTFEDCDGEVAYPPGVYVTEIDGASTGYSTFQQYYTGVYTDDVGSAVSYTVGTTVTPSSAQMTPASSNCQTYPTISAGIGLTASQTPSPSTASPAAATSGLVLPSGASNDNSGGTNGVSGVDANGSAGTGSGGPSRGGSGGNFADSASSPANNVAGGDPSSGALSAYFDGTATLTALIAGIVAVVALY